MFDELSILGSQNLLFETFCEVHKPHGYSLNSLFQQTSLENHLRCLKVESPDIILSILYLSDNSLH